MGLGAQGPSSDSDAEHAEGQEALAQQLADWKRDPVWIEVAPTMEVLAPKDAFIKVDCTCILAIPPDLVYDTITDPDNRRVFKNIKGVMSRRVVEDDGTRQVVEVCQLAFWKFLFLSGTFGVNLRVTQDREALTMESQLLEPGFFRHFTGVWRLQALPVPPSATLDRKFLLASTTTTNSLQQTTSSGSAVAPEPHEEGVNAGIPILSIKAQRVMELSQGPCLPWYGPGTRVATFARFEQEVSPASNPPPWLAGFLRGISGNATLDMLKDFQAEAARLRSDAPSDTSDAKSEVEKLTREQDFLVAACPAQ